MDVDPFGLEVACRLLHVVDFECDHTVSEMLGFWGWVAEASSYEISSAMVPPRSKYI
jgi:hypothetical protein